MLKREDTKKLAELSRIEIEDNELDSITGEIDSILGYVGQISSAVSSADQGSIELGSAYNVLREDENPNESGKYTEELLAEAPNTEKGFIKVKKIL